LARPNFFSWFAQSPALDRLPNNQKKVAHQTKLLAFILFY
jgi:hypothetical protein